MVTTTIMVGITLIGRTAGAGPKEAAAREATAQGTAAYNLAQYDEAATHYETAYKLVQDPALLFNIAQSYRFAGHADRALATYRSYLRTAPSDAPNRGQVEKRIAELEKVAAATQNEKPVAPSTRKQVAEPSQASTLPSVHPARKTDHETALDLRSPAPLTSEPERAPIYTRWGFWVGVATVVAAGGIAAFMLSPGKRDTTPTTPLGNQSIFR